MVTDSNNPALVKGLTVDTSTIITIAVALIPAIALLIFIYLQDKYEKEPIGLLLLILFLGVVSCAPALLFEWLFSMAIDVTFGGAGTITYLAIYAFFGVGIVEEFVKFLAAYIPTWRNRHFNYKFDGVVYCLFASMGFAALENALYLLSYSQDSFLLVTTEETVRYGIERGLLAIPAHGMCAIFMGYYYGNAKYLKSYGDRSGCRKSLVRGFVIASSLHAFYDFCLFTGNKFFTIIFYIFVIAADIFTVHRIIKARKEDQKMYEKPKYRQYWVNADPYQLYGGYQAPTWGGYDYAQSGAQPGGMPQTAGQQQYMPQGATAQQGGMPQQGNQYMPQGGQQYMPQGQAQQPAQQFNEYGQPVQQQSQSQQSYQQPVQQAAQAPVQQAPQQMRPSERMMKCPNCGEINSFLGFNCKKCGRSLHDLPSGTDYKY